MIQKKICMLGAFAVGKTSLISRYVNSLFSEKYHSTIGIKVDKKQISVNGHDMTLMLWDIAGQDDFQTVQPSWLRGMAGYLLVADGTRRATLDMARQLHVKSVEAAGDVPFILLLNKADLASEWEIDEPLFIKLAEQGWHIIRTSAKTGEGVEAAFEQLARMIAPQAKPGGEL
jgi:small GTP-binding protein